MDQDQFSLIPSLMSGECKILRRERDYLRLAIVLPATGTKFVAEFQAGAWHIWAPVFRYHRQSKTTGGVDLVQTHETIAIFPSPRMEIDPLADDSSLIFTFQVDLGGSFRDHPLSVNPIHIEDEANDETAADLRDMLDAMNLITGTQCFINWEVTSGSTDLRYMVIARDQKSPPKRSAQIREALTVIANFYRPRGQTVQVVNNIATVHGSSVNGSIVTNPSSHQLVRAEKTLTDFFKRMVKIGLVESDPTLYVEGLKPKAGRDGT